MIARTIAARLLDINDALEAGRHLGNDLRARRPGIAWRRIPVAGTLLRHECDRVAPGVIWHVIQEDLDHFDAVCREKPPIAQAREQDTQES